jgi:ABC-type Fe3+-siderophore transport system permease subunit
MPLGMLPGAVFIFAGCGLILRALQRRKLASPDVWGKTDRNEPLSILGCVIYLLIGLYGVVFGLNFFVGHGR